MDIPQVLAVLRPGEDWGPCAQSDSTYARLAATWRSPASTCPTEAEMLATWAIIEANRPTATRDAQRARAVALASDPAGERKLLRALLLLAMDENNALRSWIASFKAAVAGAATFAAFKTAVAALPATPQRTASQIKPALVARVSTPDAD